MSVDNRSVGGGGGGGGGWSSFAPQEGSTSTVTTSATNMTAESEIDDIQWQLQALALKQKDTQYQMFSDPPRPPTQYQQFGYSSLAPTSPFSQGISGGILGELNKPPPLFSGMMNSGVTESITELTPEERLMKSMKQQNQWLMQQQLQQQEKNATYTGSALLAQSMGANGNTTTQCAVGNAKGASYKNIAEQLNQQAANAAARSTAASLNTTTSLSSKGGDVIIAESELCPIAMACQNTECTLLHWPTVLCRHDSKNAGQVCRGTDSGLCPFLHMSQMQYIIYDSNQKRIGIKMAGLATVPNGGKLLDRMR